MNILTRVIDQTRRIRWENSLHSRPSSLNIINHPTLWVNISIECLLYQVCMFSKILVKRAELNRVFIQSLHIHLIPNIVGPKLGGNHRIHFRKRRSFICGIEFRCNIPATDSTQALSDFPRRKSFKTKIDFVHVERSRVTESSSGEFPNIIRIQDSHCMIRPVRSTEHMMTGQVRKHMICPK